MSCASQYPPCIYWAGTLASHFAPALCCLASAPNPVECLRRADELFTLEELRESSFYCDTANILTHSAGHVVPAAVHGKWTAVPRRCSPPRHRSAVLSDGPSTATGSLD